MVKECWGGEIHRSVRLAQGETEGIALSSQKKNVCLKKTFKCQKVQEIRLVRNESLSFLGECERNQSNSELIFIFLHDVIEQNQEVATQ